MRIRRLIAPGVCAAAVAYFLTAGRLELGAIAAQTPAAAGEARRHHVDRALLMADVRTLASPAFEGRRTGSPGGLKARQWIVDRFKSLGLAPTGSSGYLQPFSFTDMGIGGRVLPGRPFHTTYSDAANVLGAIAGAAAAKTIVISAHYDHLGVHGGAVYAGADDNASGVATLVAIAREFTGERPVHRLVFAAFDAEELGLRGARTFVASGLVALDRIALNVNLDMVSRSDRNEIAAAGTQQSPWLMPLLQDVQRRSRVKILVGHDRPIHKASGVEDWTDQSDQGAFAERGVPYLYFGVEDHDDYHQPTDTADKIDPRFFGDVADMIVDAVKTIDAKID